MEMEGIVDSENVIRLYCKEVFHEREEDLKEWGICKYTVFIATSEGG